MKKTINLLLVSLLLLILSSCNSNPETSITTSTSEPDILGLWITESSINYSQSPSSNPESSSVDTLHHIEFYNDGTGQWTISFNSHHPSAQRKFNYILSGNTIKFSFDDEQTDEYVISCSSDSLLLDGRVSIQLVRKD